MSAKGAVVKVMIEGVLQEIFVRTNVENVLIGEGEHQVTLAAKLAEVIASLNEKAKKADVTAEISAAIDGLIGGAPEAYDTLKELADYISTHEDVVKAINAAIGNKVDKVQGKGLSANDFTNELKEKLESMGAMASRDKVGESDLDTALAQKLSAAVEGNHSHANQSVLDGITVEKVTQWDAAQANTIEGVKVNGQEIQLGNDKKADIPVPKIYVQTAEPPLMREGDLLLQMIE